MFEFLDHTADVAVRLRSRNEAEFFQDAAGALLAIILDSGGTGSVESRLSLPIDLEAEDGEALLVDFLNELIFLFDTQRFLCGHVDLHVVRLLKPSRLTAVLQGETYSPPRHSAKTEVKATTFHGMEIRRTAEGLEADVVFDL